MKHPLFVRLAIAAASLFLVTSVSGAPFAKRIDYIQPGGEKIVLWGEGDEFHAVFETLDGYSVVFDSVQGGYCYAVAGAGGSLSSSGILVDTWRKNLPAGLTPHLRASKAAVQAEVAARRKRWDPKGVRAARWEQLKAEHRAAEALVAQSGGAAMAPPSFTTTGTKVGLCLLVDFDDDTQTVARAEIDGFCNGDAYTGFGNNGSVKKYYQDVSGGLLTYSNFVTAYVRIPNSLHPKSYYNNTAWDCGTNGNHLIKDALDILKAQPNYNTEILPALSNLTLNAGNQVVACNVFYAGGNGNVWSYGLWPHSWGLYVVGEQELSPGGISVMDYQISNIGSSLELGTFCHENGHMLMGYPDIYDYDYDSIGGAGYFCLMNSGGHGANPVQVCAYLRNASGWCTVADLDSTSFFTATLTAAPDSGFNNILRYRKPGVSTEYFLAENRRATGRDANLPASGIAIWHVDELGDHDNQSLVTNSIHANYEVTLVQADNLWQFESNSSSGDANDLYYSGNTATGYSNALSDVSGPNAHWWDGGASGLWLRNFSASGPSMSFDVVGTGGTSAPVFVMSPSSLNLPVGSTAVFQAAVSGASPKFYQWRTASSNLVDDGRFSGTGTNRLVISNVQTQDVGGYFLFVSNALGSATSSVATLSVITTPTIVTQPSDLAVDAGSPASFTVVALGAPPLSYQWWKGASSISGATNPMYSISVVTTNDAGNYSAVIGNSYGSVTSAPAVLAVARAIALGEALDATGYVWSTSGDANWKGQVVTTYDGIDAAQSGTITNNQQSVLSATFTGPLLVKAWWRVSSESGYDFLDVRVDGVVQASISGDPGWQQMSCIVPAGSHVVSWVYSKDYSESAGYDRGWIDMVTTNPPVSLTLQEALNDMTLAWTTGPSFAWNVDVGTSHDGVASGRSADVDDSQSSTLQTVVTGPGTLTFWTKVSSEPNYDFLRFYIDGGLSDSISGESVWAQKVYRLASGSHTLQWSYIKDFSESYGSDAGFVDQVSYVPDLPVILTNPASASVEAGYPVLMSVAANGATPLQYQWQLGGSPIAGATNTAYGLNIVSTNDNGVYTVVVSNGNGSVTSTNAVLTVQPAIALALALDATSMVWTTGGDGFWFGQQSVNHDGSDAVRITHLFNSQTNWVKSAVTGPGSLSFWWRASSETNADVAVFRIDGVERGRLSGESGWVQQTLALSPGLQQLQWTYGKDASGSSGLDAAWLDQVIFIPGYTTTTTIASGALTNGFRVIIPTDAGWMYYLESSPTLVNPSWDPLPGIPGSGSVMELNDPSSSSSQRFYRIRAK